MRVPKTAHPDENSCLVQDSICIPKKRQENSFVILQKINEFVNVNGQGRIHKIAANCVQVKIVLKIWGILDTQLSTRYNKIL